MGCAASTAATTTMNSTSGAATGGNSPNVPRAVADGAPAEADGDSFVSFPVTPPAEDSPNNGGATPSPKALMESDSSFKDTSAAPVEELPSDNTFTSLCSPLHSSLLARDTLSPPKAEAFSFSPSASRSNVSEALFYHASPTNDSFGLPFPDGRNAAPFFPPIVAAGNVLPPATSPTLPYISLEPLSPCSQLVDGASGGYCPSSSLLYTNSRDESVTLSPPEYPSEALRSREQCFCTPKQRPLSIHSGRETLSPGRVPSDFSL